MKAIVVRQPWASLIANGVKTIELRTWTTKHLGPLLIVAGKALATSPEARKYDVSDETEWPRGCAVAIVDLIGIHPATRRDSKEACCPVDTTREFSWDIELIRKLTKPISVRGQQGLFEVKRKF